MIDFERILQNIRSKPEKERMRYVYVAAGIVMILVLFIWFLSLQVTFHDMRPDPTSSSIDTLTDKLNESLKESNSPSIEDLIEEGSETKESIDLLQNLTQEDLQEIVDEENF